MVAKQQVKKKGKVVKKNKPQKKLQKARQKQKLQARKQKKPNSCRCRKAKQTPRTKAASSEQPRICSPRLFASKILRQMPNVRMEAEARDLVKTLLMDLFNHVATKVEILSQNNDLSSISCADIQHFLKDAMANELAKHTADSTSTAQTTRITPMTSTTANAITTLNVSTIPKTSTPTLSA